MSCHQMIMQQYKWVKCTQDKYLWLQHSRCSSATCWFHRCSIGPTLIARIEAFNWCKVFLTIPSPDAVDLTCQETSKIIWLTSSLNVNKMYSAMQNSRYYDKNVVTVLSKSRWLVANIECGSYLLAILQKFIPPLTIPYSMPFPTPTD